MMKKEGILPDDNGQRGTYTDPVCGMEVDHERYTLVEENKKYHFCSAGCLEKFRNSPSAYLAENEYDLIIITAGEGAKAAIAAKKYVVDLKKRNIREGAAVQ